MKLFHGSNAIVEHPEIRIVGYNKDFGFGFYCTLIEKQAVRWALTRSGKHYVNVYDYTPNPALCILKFEQMSEEWLDFIIECRKGCTHPYDLVEGPMADDTIWNYIEDFISGSIDREAFWALARFRHPTHQLVFCTDKALNEVCFERGYEV